MADKTPVEWRVSTHIGPDGAVLARHAFRDLSGQIAQAVCEHTSLTERLAPDDPAVRGCPLCALFLAFAADQVGDGERRQ